MPSVWHCAKYINIPYRSKLTERIEPGQTLIIRGKTIDESKRFNINLHKDSPDFSGNDVPLHLSIRFDEGKIVYNAYTKGAWGKEERAKNPIKKGENFDIRIRAHDGKFQVSINHKEVKNFEHRIPLNSVSHLSIDGDVILNHVQWGGKYYPVPYESGIASDGLIPGKTLVVYGTPEKKAKKFNINLLKKNGDIALHFNPRFDEKSVVRNSLVNGEWGNEEREGKNPFERLTAFDLEIRNEEFAFQIFVNGERFASYAHRVDPHDIAGLQIQGDIELTGIQVVNNSQPVQE
ncbi:CBN-LEC-3 protein [Caenorhabditis brenneri]|uniref:Galectin n=1 Tax=Caenorhabditis brenneri TaxID=135651 RepID=G0NAL5_CAEBE|nr:CBN-LEC-3 protein [Caenorhabditis brenneri]